MHEHCGWESGGWHDASVGSSQTAETAWRFSSWRSSPGVLSDREGVTSAAIAEVLRSLEARGFVMRERDPGDGRRIVVTVTASGAASLADRDAAVTSRLAQVLAESLTEQERGAIPQLTAILEKVAKEL